MPQRRRPKIDVEIIHDAGQWNDREDIEPLIEAAVAEVAAERRLVPGKASVTVVLSDDASIADLNGQFRSKPKPTNVLSFPPGPGAPDGYLGDIILAAETLAREAQDQDIALDHHIQHLVVHGILHLIGFDHEDDKSAEIMEKLEIEILARLGVANPYTGALERDKT